MRQVVAVYNYTDENGTVLYRKLRYEPKEFAAQQPDGKGGWVWSLKGVRRVLYRLPDLMQPPLDRLVWIVEGEKDADSLAALGRVATTNDGGAGKWLPELVGPLRGRHVVLIPDNDDQGRNHVRQVTAALRGVAASVAVVELPDLPPKGDVSDWLAAGGTVDDLLRLAEQATRQTGPTEKQTASPQSASAPEPWDDPIPLQGGSIPVMPFPQKVFPTDIAEYFVEAASAIGCPVDYTGCFGLGIIAGSAGAIYAVDVKAGYVEPLSCYLCVVAPKGSGKTPALKTVAAPIYTEAGRRHECKEDQPAYVSDVTVEKVADLLREYPRGLLVIRDELSGWMRSMDQYKAKGSGSDRQFWLSVNSNDPVSVHRKDSDRPPVFVQHPSVTVLGGIQPPVLTRLKGDDDGFYDRILFSYADPLPAKGETWAAVPRAVADSWQKTVLAILEARMLDADGKSRPFFLRFSAGARQEWETWTTWIAEQRNSPDFPDFLKGPAVKLTGFAARLAGVMHVLREVNLSTVPTEIEREDMQAGAALARYFLSHARKVYIAMGRDPRIEDAAVVLSWLRTWGKPSFSRRDVFRGLRRSFERPEDLLPPLKLLQSHGFIRWVDPVEAGLSRSHTTIYTINPRALSSGDRDANGDMIP